MYKTKVKCEVCGRLFWFITYRHLKKHNLSTLAYRRLYPHTKFCIKSCSEKERKRLAKLSRENWANTDFRQKMKINKFHSKGGKTSLGTTGLKMSEKQKQAKSKQMSDYWKHADRTKHRILTSQGITQQSKQKRSKTMKNLWKNEEYREKQIKCVLQGLFKRPTSLEQKFIDFLEKYELPFSYCGDGSLLIGYKNPDFYENNGIKLCIEVADPFFHQPTKEYEEKRLQHFLKWGWQCIVIWDDELYNEQTLLQRVLNFLHVEV